MVLQLEDEQSNSKGQLRPLVDHYIENPIVFQKTLYLSNSQKLQDISATSKILEGKQSFKEYHPQVHLVAGVTAELDIRLQMLRSQKRLKFGGMIYAAESN